MNRKRKYVTNEERRAAMRIASRKYRLANLDKARARWRKYFENNRERLQSRWKKYHTENRERELQRSREYRLALTPVQKEARRQSAKRRYNEVREAMLVAYGYKCVCCGETAREFLNLDHVNGDGKQHRIHGTYSSYLDLKRRNWPQDGYRLLCWNCNMSRGNYGYCPHAKKEGAS